MKRQWQIASKDLDRISLYPTNQDISTSLLRIVTPSRKLPDPQKILLRSHREEYETIRGKGLCFTFPSEIIRLAPTPAHDRINELDFQPLASHFSDRAKIAEGWTGRYKRESRVNGLHCTFKRPWLQPPLPATSDIQPVTPSLVSSPRPTLPFAIIQRWQTTVLSYESAHPPPVLPAKTWILATTNPRVERAPLAGLQFLIFVRRKINWRGISWQVETAKRGWGRKRREEKLVFQLQGTEGIGD